ncbi:putative tRNA adenylyltransferase [Kockovaella imperatae]|uniref:Putative tRNA adenylyltransferase n=1 Tax=Kockovaella imperatae TaxID=4999 RepID=A0A1Y1UPC2_9TREE|nr:putative tRNA adenylyltransferase [Kockovaella imperatae]ORX39900.1 putative tRNA adenylyltransferase [Kockovaella imperatae]
MALRRGLHKISFNRPLSIMTSSVTHADSAIELDPKESLFVKHLDEFSQSLKPVVECRIAGGWVRDKLLRLPSSDLDVALSTASGYQFALNFVEHLRARDISTGTVGKVAANPEQSKHLETGTTRIMDLECDFVGLRSETYADSRIPTEVRLGTPLEDAQRRDLTINALFYNVHTRQVEDWTGYGLADLRNRIARTPLPPRQTFVDDPLRVVRCVRFASRFDLVIEDEVMRAIDRDDIKVELRSKVSKERIGSETLKIMQKTPLRGLTLIDRLNLHSSIFTCAVDPPRSDALTAGMVLSAVLPRLKVEPDEILWLAAALYPFRDLVVQGKKPTPAVASVIGEGLKLSNETRDGVTKLFIGAKIVADSLDATSRSTLGLTLRHPSVQPLWHRTLCWSAVMAVMEEWSGAWDDKSDGILTRFLAFEDRVRELDLEPEIGRRPLLDGKRIQEVLSLKPGPILQIITENVVAWQLDHPGSTQTECEEWLRESWEGRKRVEWEATATVKKRK